MLELKGELVLLSFLLFLMKFSWRSEKRISWISQTDPEGLKPDDLCRQDTENVDMDMMDIDMVGMHMVDMENLTDLSRTFDLSSRSFLRNVPREPYQPYFGRNLGS